MRRYRSLLFLGVAALLLWLLLRRQGEDLPEVLALLPRVNWALVALAVGLQGLFFLDQAALCRAIAVPLRFRLPLGRLYLLVLAMAGASRVVPVGTAAGVAVFAQTLAADGISALESLMNQAVYHLLDYAAFVVFLFAGVIYLIKYQKLAPGLLSAALLLAVLIAAAAVVFLLLILRPQPAFRLLQGLLSRLNAAWRKRLGRELVAGDPILANLANALAVLRSFGHQGTLLWAVALAAGLQVIDLGILYALFAAIGQGVPLGTLVAGFGVATLFSLLTFVPNGLGVFAASMAWVYAYLGLPGPAAAAVALLYRAVTFWLPVPAGLLGYYYLQRGRRSGSGR
ncbi:MAG: lysylphosphatidylglycerol synthase transmembrane domain-containing protein [Moorellales bacterium]